VVWGAGCCVVGLVGRWLAVYFGGLVATIFLALVVVWLALPCLRLALVLGAIFGPSIGNAALALTVVALPHYVRLTRAAVLVEVNRHYVTASRVAGAGAMRQLVVNHFPNCLAPTLLPASRAFSQHSLDMAARACLCI
ncbi:ABC transporter permease subunit, partial [Salmonella enterica]|uniref:ABC transporter permease subunit n=1 Tax=Salmonella enterica TaxID=28901 RepID=UPI00398C5A88